LLELAEAKIAGIQNSFKIYIAPESEHIFEPILGDRDEGGYIYDDFNGWIRRDTYGGDADYATDCEITIRDDKHFFMPEREEINND